MGALTLKAVTRVRDRWSAGVSPAGMRASCPRPRRSHLWFRSVFLPMRSRLPWCGSQTLPRQRARRPRYVIQPPCEVQGRPKLKGAGKVPAPQRAGCPRSTCGVMRLESSWACLYTGRLLALVFGQGERANSCPPILSPHLFNPTALPRRSGQSHLSAAFRKHDDGRTPSPPAPLPQGGEGGVEFDNHRYQRSELGNWVPAK